MKKAVFLVFLAGIVMMCGGCTKKYGRNEISDYVKETCGIRGFKVHKDRQELKGTDDEYTDYLWTVEEDDGTVFHVLDDYHWGMEALVNTLRTDYFDVHLINAYPQLPHSNTELEVTENEGLFDAVITGSFTNRAELDALLDELDGFRSDASCPQNAAYSLRFQFPYHTIGDYEATEGDTHGNLRDPINTAEAEQKMLLTCVDHRLPALADFTEAEIRNAVAGNTHQLGVRTGETTYEWYDDLCASQFSYGVSFGSLYELLVRNGYPVDGTADHYTFTAADGTEYEISYSFRHSTADHSEGYYYLKNGEETDMEYYFYNHFHTGKIKELFGLEAEEYWMAH